MTLSRKDKGVYYMLLILTIFVIIMAFLTGA